MKQNLLPLPTPKADAVDVSGLHSDNMYNAIVGLGKEADKSLRTRPAPALKLVDMELSDMWDSEGLAKKIITCVPDDAIRPGFTIPCDTDGKLVKELERIGLVKALQESAYWARLYGGSLMVGGYADGLEPSEPRRSTPTEIKWIKVYSVPNVILTGIELESDPKNPRYEKPNYYPVLPLTGVMTTVNHTRTCELKGVPVADQRRTSNFRERYWGLSIIQSMWNRIAGLGGAMQGLDTLLLEYSIAVYKLQGLGPLVASGQSDKVIQRMSLMSMSKSMLRGLMLDSTEDFSRVTTPLTGVSDLLEKQMMMVSAVSNIPMERLFGKAQGGIGNKGESGLKLYYDDVINYQKTYLTPVALHWVRQVNAYLGVCKDEDIEIEWGHPNAETEAEKITTRKTQADIDNIYLTAGVLTPDEVRQSRFGGNKYSTDTTIEEGSSAPSMAPGLVDPKLNQGEAGPRPKIPAVKPPPPKKAPSQIQGKGNAQADPDQSPSQITPPAATK